MNKTINNLVESLVLSAKMQKSFTINGDHINPVALATWTSAVRKVHTEAYKVVAIAHDDDLTKMDSTIDKSALFGAIREVLALVGEVNGHKLNCNESVAIMSVIEATKSVNEFHGEALTVKSQLTNVRKQLKDIEDITEGINKEYRENLVAKESELSNRLNELKLVPDMVTVERTRVSDKAFRSAFEHYLGDVVTSQKMKSWDELEAEAKAKKDARNKKNNENKRTKRAEEAKAKAKAESK